MGIMRKALAAGYSYDAEEKPDSDPKQDPDLDALRDRDDFKKLIADLEQKSPSKPQLASPPREIKQVRPGRRAAL